jgi:hypothetical protein
MMTHNMYCGTSEEDVVATARDPFNGHLAALTSAARSWGEGLTSKDHPGYEKMLDGLSRNNFDRMREQGIAWCGTPEQICDMIATCYRGIPGGVETVSLQVNFHTVPLKRAVDSIRRFAEQVMPRSG